jgi:RNA polymerase sigma-54 factor
LRHFTSAKNFLGFIASLYLPDVTMEKMNGDQIPHLRISNTYKDIMAQDGNGSDVKDYIRDKIRGGKFLIRSIHQRQQTISNIAQQIVSQQRDFLEHGSSLPVWFTVNPTKAMQV